MEIPGYVWDIITTEVQKIQHGTLTLIAQDGLLIQIDRIEKIRLTKPEASKPKKLKPPESKLNSETLRLRLSEVLKDLRYGQVVIAIKDNKIAQIERLEKQRVDNLVGLFGDGI
ncbi:MAG: hypothetical protein H6Q74_341 [Firmicutes bacterium]|nr:hypothetical protein [Bacillota bacterium]